MSDSGDLPALIATLETQEEQLLFSRFAFRDAWTIGSRLVALAEERKLSIAIDIQRNGQQLFHAALDGTAPDNDHWLRRKTNVVNRFGHSSYLVGRQLELRGIAVSRDNGLDPTDYAAHGGSFPIRVVGVGVVGSVTVSGLPQADDHALVVEVLTEFLAG